MNIPLLTEVEAQIASNNVPARGPLFAGAGLIVDSKPGRRRHDDDVFVLTPLAKQISWVIYRMKEVFFEELDHINKLSFYPELGNVANCLLQQNLSEREVLFGVVGAAKDFWSNRPLHHPSL